MKPLLICAIIALTLAGCAKPPQAEIDAARSALGEAQAAGAELYAPDALAAAVSAVAQMDAEVLVQSRRGALTRRYDTASELAASATKAALDAKGEADGAKEQLRIQLAPELPALADAIPAASGLVANALKVRGIKLDAAAIDAEIAAIAALVADADNAYDAQRFADANSMAIEAKQRLDAVQKQVQEAIDAARRTTGRRS